MNEIIENYAYENDFNYDKLTNTANKIMCLTINYQDKQYNIIEETKISVEEVE